MGLMALAGPALFAEGSACCLLWHALCPPLALTHALVTPDLGARAHRDVSRVFCEFLEVAVHQILFVRSVYPAELFERKRKYNVPVRQSRHKDLNDYIANAGAHLRRRSCCLLLLTRAHVPTARSR